jgi:hypothetical protein
MTALIKDMTTPFHTTPVSPGLSSFNSAPVPMMTIVEKPLERSDKPKKARCAHYECNIKLGLMGFDCKCGFKYCASHRLPESHNCDFDHKSADKAVLAKQLVRCVGDKMGDGRI